MAYFGDGYGPQRLTMFPPVIKWLIGINVLIFLIGFVPMGVLGGQRVTLDNYLTYYGALWPIGLQGSPFNVWQYFTYMFLHGGFFHIFLNMLVLWMFGMELEQMWGSKRFLVFYLLCGLGAGIIHSIVTQFIGDPGPTIGASGAIMGVMIAFGMVFPDRLLLFMFFIPMRAKYLVYVYAAYDLFNGIMPSSGEGMHIAHFAHLGGLLVGYILLKIGGPLTLGGIFDRIPGFSSRSEPPVMAPRAPRQQQYASRPNIIDADFRDIPTRAPRRNDPPKMDFGSDQARIDAILDKISKTGYQNLTEEEKALLVEASKKLK